jgi:putative nucleotidyltransferase with HDIG domain
MASWIKLLLQKYPKTYHHSVRVAMLAEKMAQSLELSSVEKDYLVRGSFLHDIGKSIIPSEIILQKEPLTESQRDIAKLYPIIGAEIVESHPGFGTEITQIIRYHQERWDGSGYPEGLCGEEIPYAARICAVIDAFDFMTSNQRYHKRCNVGEAKMQLLKQRGTQFDPDIVHALIKLPDPMLNIFSLD